MPIDILNGKRITSKFNVKSELSKMFSKFNYVLILLHAIFSYNFMIFEYQKLPLKILLAIDSNYSSSPCSHIRALFFICLGGKYFSMSKLFVYLTFSFYVFLSGSVSEIRRSEFYFPMYTLLFISYWTLT